VASKEDAMKQNRREVGNDESKCVNKTPKQRAMPDETDMVSQARTSPKALGVLFEWYCKPIWMFCMARLRNAADAEDATQRTFHDIIKIAEKLDPAKSFSGLVHRIAHARCMDILRKRYKAAHLEEQYTAYLEATCSDWYCPKDCTPRVACLWDCVEGLTPGEKALLAMRFVEGYTGEEISRALGLPMWRVFTSLNTVVKKLRRMMAERGFGLDNVSGKTTKC
jgi:RNA polymerase sigma factor (sigma-70 family)